MAYFLATNVLSTTPPSVTPFIFADGNQYVDTGILDTNVNKVETDLYVTNASLGGNGIMGSYWGGSEWLLAQDGGIAWMTSPRTYFTTTPTVGGHQLVMDLMNGSTYDGISVSSPGATIGNRNLNIYLYSAGASNYGNIGIGRTKLYNQGVLLRDFVPINEIGKVDTIAEQWFTNTGNIIINPTISNRTFIRDYLRIETKLEDSNGIIHFADPMYISISNFTPGSGEYFTYDNGMQSYIDVWNDQIRLAGKYPAGAARVFVGLYNSGNTKEGGFYDTVGQKYYFSNTSTPLVYSEL